MRMDMLTREILNQSIAEAIDATRNKICAEDEVYQQDEKDLDELTKRFMELDLPEHDRMIINDYIACLQTVDCRYADISYILTSRNFTTQSRVAGVHICMCTSRAN